MTRMARCSCGSLRAEVSGDPIYVIACHCDECQRRTGSVVGVGAYYKREQVQINGPNKAFVRAGPENRTVTNHFCPECGTPLFWQGDIAPGIVGNSSRRICRPWLSAAEHLLFREVQTSVGRIQPSARAFSPKTYLSAVGGDQPLAPRGRCPLTAHLSRCRIFRRRSPH
jgi:hypothetical protein